MSQPILNETQNGKTSLAVDTTGGILRVTNDPGFSSDNGDGCPYRAVYLTDAAGVTVFGHLLDKTTDPSERWPGFFESRAALEGWRLALSPGEYSLIVYGGSYFAPWVPGQPGPFIEWGWTDQGKNPSGTPIGNIVPFTIVAPPPLPPADARLTLDPRLPEIRDNTLIELHAATATYAMWKEANPKEAALAQNYLAMIVATEAGFPLPTPPSLKTHKGRGIIGLLQAGAATIGRLP